MFSRGWGSKGQRCGCKNTLTLNPALLKAFNRVSINNDILRISISVLWCMYKHSFEEFFFFLLFERQRNYYHPHRQQICIHYLLYMYMYHWHIINIYITHPHHNRHLSSQQDTYKCNLHVCIHILRRFHKGCPFHKCVLKFEIILRFKRSKDFNTTSTIKILLSVRIP